jgi:serine/threonine-protein kinase
MVGVTFERGREIPGTQYRFVKELGTGGQGSVVLAKDPFLDQLVVIKLLAGDVADRADLAKHIQQEARLLAALKHDHIVRVLAGGVTSERVPRPYFVMDFLEGMTLHRVIKSRGGRGIPVRSALNIAYEILLALDYAHTHPKGVIIHRDIKPANVLLVSTDPGHAKAVLLDFGIAKLYKPTKATGGFAGTQEYSAPEQLQGHTVPQSDLYAVGLLLFEMIAGHHAFSDCKTRGEYIEAHLKRKAPRLSAIGEGISPAVDAIVASALEKDPARRPRSAFAFADKLRSIRATLDIENAEQAKMQAATDEMPMAELQLRMGLLAPHDEGSTPQVTAREGAVIDVASDDPRNTTQPSPAPATVEKPIRDDRERPPPTAPLDQAPMSPRVRAGSTDILSRPPVKASSTSADAATVIAGGKSGSQDGVAVTPSRRRRRRRSLLDEWLPYITAAVVLSTLAFVGVYIYRARTAAPPARVEAAAAQAPLPQPAVSVPPTGKALPSITASVIASAAPVVAKPTPSPKPTATASTINLKDIPSGL